MMISEHGIVMFQNYFNFHHYVHQLYSMDHHHYVHHIIFQSFSHPIPPIPSSHSSHSSPRHDVQDATHRGRGQQGQAVVPLQAPGDHHGQHLEGHATGKVSKSEAMDIYMFIYIYIYCICIYIYIYICIYV